MRRPLTLAVVAALAGHALLLLLWLTAAPLNVVVLAWLGAALVFVGIGSGTQAIFCIQCLTGGRWLEALEPPLGWFARVTPLIALSLVVALFAMPSLFPWAGDSPAASAYLIAKKRLYLNEPFMILRTAAFVATTFLLAFWTTGKLNASRSAIGLILWLLSVSMLAVDWVMSLQPEWYSTAIGLWLAASFVLSALAATITVSVLRSPALPADRRNDIAILLLAAVLFWFYVSYMQYLIIWSGDLPEEIGWFVDRRGALWQAVAAAMVLLMFVVPMATLIFRPVRRSPRLLIAVAASVVAGRMLESEWQIEPAVDAAATIQAIAAGGALLGFGGLCAVLTIIRNPAAGRA